MDAVDSRGLSAFARRVNEVSSRRQVVRIITRLNIGGPARQALLLTKEFRESWPTALLAGTAPPEEGELSDPDVKVHRLPLVRRPSPARDLRAYVRTRRVLSERSPKILHTHMAKAGMIGRLAARRSGIRTVHTYHGHVLEGYFRPSVQRAILEVERRLARTTDVLIAISPEIRDSLLDLGVGRQEQYRVIPLGFDLTEHLEVEGPSLRLRSHLGLDADVLLVGVVGRLVPIKDLRTFLRAVSLTPPIHAAVLGDGEERAALERFAKELGISDRVHFTGWWTDIPGAMSDLDLVVLTSLNEGTPVSLIEALACRRPVIATDVGGVPFVIDHGRTGILVHPNDPQTLAREVGTLLGSPATMERLAREGRESVRTRFHKDRLLTDIDALYGELTGEWRSYGTALS